MHLNINMHMNMNMNINMQICIWTLTCIWPRPLRDSQIVMSGQFHTLVMFLHRICFPLKRLIKILALLSAVWLLPSQALLSLGERQLKHVIPCTSTQYPFFAQIFLFDYSAFTKKKWSINIQLHKNKTKNICTTIQKDLFQSHFVDHQWQHWISGGWQISIDFQTFP